MPTETLPVPYTRLGPLEGVRVKLTPDETFFAVPARPDAWGAKTGKSAQPGVFAPGTRVLHTPYHVTQPAHSVLVVLRHQTGNNRSAEQRARRVRLSIVPQNPADWRPGWTNWQWVRRAPRELAGTDALSAQDNLSDDGQTLTLLLMPSEDRQAYLEFDVRFADGIRAGDRPFAIVAEDAEAPGYFSQTRRVLRVTHPPSTFLNHLPAIYRERLESDDGLPPYNPPVAVAAADANDDETPDKIVPYRDEPFFARFLRGFDDLQEPLREAVGQLSVLFAADSTPTEFLPWLATWIGAVADDSWPEMRRRRLLKEAVELFRWRGTRRGLSRYLEVYTGVVPHIDDQPFAGLRLGGPGAVLGAGDSARLGNIAPHTFVVTLALPAAAPVSEESVRRIIDSQKPAHTTYTLRVLTRQ